MAFHQFKLPPVMPVLLATYGYDLTLAGGFMSAYALAGLLLSLPLGRLIQRHGAVRYLRLAFVLLAVTTFLGIAAPADGVVMLTARSFEGVAFAICAICGPALASQSASPRQLPLVLGLIATWIPLGQLTAIGLAPLALSVGKWWWLWLAGLVLTLAMAAWMRTLTKAGRLAPATTGNEEQSTGGDGRYPRWTRVQLIGLVLAATMFMLWSAQYFAYMTWLPQYLVEVHGLSEIAAVASYSLPVAVLLVVNVLTGVALRAGAPLGCLLVFALLFQAGVWWGIPVTTGPMMGSISLVVYGIGAGITPTCLFALPAAVLGGAQAGPRAFAVVMTGRNMGVLIGPVLLAQAYSLMSSWTAAVPIFAAATTAAAVFASYFVAGTGKRRAPGSATGI